MLDVNPAGFGRLENRMSHYGALNTFYNNTPLLFDAETLAKIRAIPYTRTIQIPVLNGVDWTIITVRTCAITTQALGATLKTVVRFHVEFDVDIIPSEYQNNYVTYQAALAAKIKNAKKAVYKYLDQMCATFLDANKETTQTIGANLLYTGVAGEYQVPKLIDFYNNLGAIMEMMDTEGPYFDIANTAALADQNWLNNPGGGAIYDTAAIKKAANIAEFDYTNRISPGAGQRGIHYVGPMGSIGIVNFIDFDYQGLPDLNAIDVTDEKDISDVRFWGRINDNVYPTWEWGTQQLLDCTGGAKSYGVKHAADFALFADFTRVAGESPIKRFSVMNA
ncbi:hypothetical protein [Spirosoma sp. 48-14]|uniref:hypothetical protein n=1 Tax=Spirosoma sp. 48-14 TaxID=1895854 RepID=UPI00095F364E|nr:hypothetical protein [Spirosoma sp. 48-14]OJW78437.1 MAG: hypothetical protein BGO59_31025 [Spirosoma sp. 48-14]